MKTTNKRCIAIAYASVLTPVDFLDYDMALAIGIYDTLKPDNRDNRVIYRAILPNGRPTSHQADVSGDLGIFFPLTDEATALKAKASERLLADALIFELSRIAFDGNETIVLLQGPMLPKLRGRLLYSGFPEQISIWSITYQPDWFRRLEAAEHIARHLDSTTDISSVYPPKGIDSASRTWICRLDEKMFYHLESIVDSSYLCNTDWESKCKAEIQLLLKNEPSDYDGHFLPDALAMANETAQTLCKIEKDFVWFLPRLAASLPKINEINESEPIANIVKRMDPDLVPLGPLFKEELRAASGTFNWANKNEVYKAFRDEWKVLHELVPKER